MKQKIKTKEIIMKQREIDNTIQEIRVAERDGTDNMIKKYVNQAGLSPKQQNSYLLSSKKFMRESVLIKKEEDEQKYAVLTS